MTKRCSRCQEYKNLDEFHRNSATKDGRASHCKSCHHRDYYDLEEWRERRFKRVYGITLEEYASLYDEQGGRCALCGGESNGRGRLAVDHDHETGRVRGLLCFSCNTALGRLERIGLDTVLGYATDGAMV